MNERILELSAIARHLSTDEATHLSRVHNRTLSLDEEQELFTEKFALLIVREFCDWIDGSPATEAGQLLLTKSFITANLKGHFGVRE